MKQAIAGVTPPESEETTVMEVWPSVARYSVARVLGRLFANDAGIYVFKIGNLIALAAIPVGLALYFFRLLPYIRIRLPYFGQLPMPHGSFYKLTNRRVRELRNEVHLGPGSRFVGWLATFGGVAIGLVLFVVHYLKFGSFDPGSGKTPEEQILSWALSALVLFHVLAGLVLLALVLLDQSLQFVHGEEMKSVQLNRFDTIRIDRHEGQAWFDAGDLVFLQAGSETFRLPGIARPEAFKSTCMKAHMAYVGVQDALQTSS
jgi:predicted ferric reductase